MQSTDPFPASLANARDVADTAAGSGGRIRPGVLLRSDAPYPGDGAPAIASWPPAYVVDLRSPGEGLGPHPLAGESTTVLNRPMLRDANPIALATAAEREQITLAEIYAKLLQVGAPIVVELASLIAAADGPVLVHCTAGKDRTGVAVAVLLAAAGVPDEQIVADFAATDQNMDGVVNRMAGMWPPEERNERLELMMARHPDLLRAPREAMVGVLRRLAEHPGGAAGWLRDHGATEDEVARLRERLVG